MKDQGGTKVPISPFVEIMASPVEIDLDSEVEEGTPLRPIFCLKRKDDIKVFEEREECFILDFDPEDDTLDPSNNSPFKGCDNGDSPDIKVIAEKGQVACRDYPHSRHLCVKHPFEKTSHESYCSLVSSCWLVIHPMIQFHSVQKCVVTSELLIEFHCRGTLQWKVKSNSWKQNRLIPGFIGCNG